MKKKYRERKWITGMLALLSLVLLTGCSGKALSGIGEIFEKKNGQKYYVEGDVSLTDEELEDLRLAVFTRARVLSKETLTETGRDSKGAYISIEFPEGSPESYYKMMEEHPGLHFFFHYRTQDEEEVLANTRIESADIYSYGDGQEEQFFLNMAFDASKQEELSRVTADHIGERITICLDDWVVCEPVIGSRITDGVVTIAVMEENQLEEIAVLLLGTNQDYDIKRKP